MSAALLSYLHLNLWPGEIVILFRNVTLVSPDDSLCKISWTFMWQIATVVVVPIEVWVVACLMPPSPMEPFSTVGAVHIIVLVPCGESLSIVIRSQGVQEAGGICVISSDTEPVQRTWFYFEPMVDGDIRLILEVFQLHQKLPGAWFCQVGHSLQAKPKLCETFIFKKICVIWIHYLFQVLQSPARSHPTVLTRRSLGGCHIGHVSGSRSILHEAWDILLKIFVYLDILCLSFELLLFPDPVDVGLPQWQEGKLGCPVWLTAG